MVEQGGSPPPEEGKKRPTFGDPVTKRRGRQQPAAQMFPDSDELPIFSGTPIPAVEHPYVPEDHSHKQEMLPGMPDIDYERVREKDKQLRHGWKDPQEPLTEGTLWHYAEAPPESAPDPPEDDRQRRLHDVLRTYNLNAEALRDLVKLGTNLNQMLRTGTAPPEVFHLLTLLSNLLRPGPREQIRSPADAAAVLMVEMGHLDQEELRTVLLDTKSRVLGIATIYRGSLNASMVRVGEVFKEAIRLNSAALIVAHNHPSSDPTPSPEDVLVTRQIVEAGKLLDVDVLDHLVIAQGKWVSLRERGLGFSD